MKKENRKQSIQDIFTGNNTDNIRTAIAQGKNLLICGVEGVGKITNTVQAVKDATNVYYLGNPFDYEGKMRPGSYEKYLKYIHSLKNDIRIVEDIGSLLTVTQPIILIIDEIYGRSEADFAEIGKLLDAANIQIIQITGCIKNMRRLIDKIDFILELHVEGAFAVEKDLAQAICKILGTEKPSAKLS